MFVSEQTLSPVFDDGRDHGTAHLPDGPEPAIGIDLDLPAETEERP
ncbi:hypothetical protein [Phytoactinopolyspora halotolerans]|uniref:Uncharacterized protein n=1 Tax=Phytoactinopolyspora halotolerans TaxID=1981512 RepID=A0A6L9S811_9ACTN|nr:hypothetical protein [Phytoactinopolyspora halotolerans]NEE00702.1 hypothetical protein [Phytoactinopolyspora halotolerans]